MNGINNASPKKDIGCDEHDEMRKAAPLLDGNMKDPTWIKCSTKWTDATLITLQQKNLMWKKHCWWCGSNEWINKVDEAVAMAHRKWCVIEKRAKKEKTMCCLQFKFCQPVQPMRFKKWLFFSKEVNFFGHLEKKMSSTVDACKFYIQSWIHKMMLGEWESVQKTKRTSSTKIT